ncbi:hypothetical protein FisN_10Hu032 [Fistulifera solaris]|uniref:Uncharacterized protein n=1 Tax=Fistulifera solaris TaxID=1519565 RepID=A0A1Z5K5A5_FISSO|nr:hypothetical protein FisN_10Hu032 [Fistulifera solaris]|eukprot:GAX21453.1 hypothetical protein FisN_10Hu032 [Fistulifera solaris]
MLHTFLFLILLTIFAVHIQAQASYGVDCSFPIHGKDFRCGDLLGDRHNFYEHFMEGCRKHYGSKANRCDVTENDRIAMSIRQPQSMVNFTDAGFMKIKAPTEVMSLLTQHWETNKANMKEEKWAAGNVYVNHWETPSYLVSVEDQSLRGGGYNLKTKIWDAAKSTIQQWTGMELKPTSMYGIRMYTEGAVLSPHVDRLPLVSSCIINVDQDVDEPWPLEVYDRQGNAVNVTMEPGDMVLYESGSLIHGRPFPLKGRFFANIFIHFEPTGRPLHATTDQHVDELDDFLPPYLVPGSPEIAHWTSQNPGGWKKPSPSAPIQQAAAPEAHFAAATGDFERLQQIVKKDKRMLNTQDANGWRALHEAIRFGDKDIVEFLVKNGAEKNARTGNVGQGSSPLNLALQFHDEKHPVVLYLREIGAEDIAEGEL